MHNPFQPGDKKSFAHTVRDEDTVQFINEKLHPVYSTYAITREAEWACRLFVLEMKDEDEEGIGTSVKVIHDSPASIGSKVVFTGIFVSVIKNEIRCAFEAISNGRLIASGETTQKILKKEKLEQVFNQN
jgi:fluoroacetyl-CoA thioesterase